MGRRSTQRSSAKTGAAATALLLVVTGFSAGGVGQAAEPGATATMSGRVSVPAGESVTAVLVHVRSQAVDGVRPSVPDPSPVRPAADGRWSVAGLGAGTYRVEFETRPESNVLGEWYGDGRWSGEAKDVVVPDGGRVAGVDEALPAGAVVTGTVRAASGAPVEGVWVLPFEENHFYGVQEFSMVAGAYTDHQGRYTLKRLRGVNHRIEVADLHGRGYGRSFLGGGRTLAQARDFALVAGRVHTGFDHRFAVGPGSEKPRVEPGPKPKPKKIVVRTKPKVSGKLAIGRTLTATRGAYTPGAAKVTFQWQVKKATKAVAVKGAKTSKLKLTKRFRGKQVRVRVTVKAKGHATLVRTTAWSKKVA
ncbi:carboxypeptidase-like regulatory domain-containing protein [Nocardioides yefusunii]|uniref:Carboxypeptidase-like regulatory domain-containing protein n=1 Tax=Nocardioides yefusunii TaxID=2500546 RepID=A0ABW1QZ20_9ACTN|nr:carboxypeptidase-like regulatory domain-containing protein [Nocardioides yefusunii]